MKLSLALLLAAVPSAASSGKKGVRGDRKNRKLSAEAAGHHSSSRSAKSAKKGDYTAPHEVHQYEQVKFNDEPMWQCEDGEIGGNVGCIECWNGGAAGDDALVVQVKAMYKRTDFNVRNETLDKPRDHCIYPRRGSFWTCFNSNLVIEPDTAWLDQKITIDGVELGPFNDKKQWDEDGNKVTDGSGDCLPGEIAAMLEVDPDTVFI